MLDDDDGCSLRAGARACRVSPPSVIVTAGPVSGTGTPRGEVRHPCAGYEVVVKVARPPGRPGRPQRSDKEHHMSTSTTTTPTRRRQPVELAATVVGAVFLLVGILGFIPGITTDYDQMSFAGRDSGAMLLGLFMVSILHNIVHLVFGVAGLALGRRLEGARSYLIVGGVVYLVLWLYGLVIDHHSAGNFVPVNNADNWLHLLLGLGMVVLGIALTRNARAGRNHR
jgi:hypothetical protein